MGALAVPKDWAGFTPGWITDALSARHPGAEVSAVEVVDIDVGTTSRARLRLEYRFGDGPKCVFVKAQGRLAHRVVATALGAMYGEARFLGYGELPLPTPELYATAIDPLRLRSVVVLEDLADRGATPNNAIEPLDPKEVAQGLDSLARLHGRFWRFTASSDPELRWVRLWRFFPAWALVFGAGIRAGVDRIGELLPEEVLPAHLQNWRQLTGLTGRALAATRTGPLTVIHGDAHVGNTYRLPDGTIGFYDWQNVRKGAWAQDVGYFMVSALEVADRRAHERDLLEHYLATLQTTGVETPLFEEAWLRYRGTPAYGLGAWLATLGLGDYQRDDVSVATVKRFAAALVDLETEDALDRFQR
jgi:hypothetical protein